MAKYKAVEGGLLEKLRVYGHGDGWTYSLIIGADGSGQVVAMLGGSKAELGKGIEGKPVSPQKQFYFNNLDELMEKLEQREDRKDKLVL
jgi:hypothetical protein